MSEVFLSPGALKQSVDDALERLKVEEPDVDENTVRLSFDREGAKINVSATFAVTDKVTGKIGAEGGRKWTGELNGKGYLEFNW